MDAKTLRADAIRVLQKNDRGGFTVPSGKLYPHQWNWDSAFCAIGWAHIDPKRAARELELLLRGQWDDGMIAHIVFDPTATDYEPGPRAWGTDTAKGAPAEAKATSITQPPIAATAARVVLEKSGGDRAVEETLRRVLDGVDRWHDWFARTRCAPGAGDGVPCIVHPWESGLDNAPRWDAALRRIDPGEISYARKDDSVVEAAQRPTRFDYDRYFFLVRERVARGFAPPTAADVSFLVKDVAMAAVLARAEEDLAHAAAALGSDAIVARARTRRERLVAAIGSALYDPERARYHDVDALTGAPVEADHVASFFPLWAGIAPEAAVDRIVALLDEPTKYGPKWPIPSVPLDDPAFDARRYWRGPSWVNVNWMIAHGLVRQGRPEHAARLRDRTLELVARSGFYEYFDPTTGEGLGANDFSWTAALCLDWL